VVLRRYFWVVFRLFLHGVRAGGALTDEEEELFSLLNESEVVPLVLFAE
jgi:hypothetical protein